MDLGGLISSELVDLSTVHGNPAFARILAPLADVGKLAPGVTRQFFENAEAYRETHFDTSYANYMLELGCGALGNELDPTMVLDVGCGPGATTIAILERFRRATVVATDVSPQLLAMLSRELRERGLEDRCSTVCLDLNKPWFDGTPFDIAFGSAILHHLFDPRVLIEQVLSAVRPGGAAAFFEPFEPGYFVMQMIYRLLSDDRINRPPLSDGLSDYFRGKIVELSRMLCTPKDPIEYADIDDKWMFTRYFFAEIADRLGAELIIVPMNRSESPFSDMMRTTLRLGLGLGPEALPDWAWQKIADIERSLSMSCKDDLLLEGCVVFVKQ